MKKGTKDLSQFERTVDDLQKKNRELKDDYTKMCSMFDDATKEIVALKRSVTSYKSSNSKLKKEVERYKNLDLEGDHLYENRIAEVENLKTELASKEKLVKEKENVIDGLNSQVGSLSQQIMTLKESIVKKNAEIKDYEAMLEYERLPWWKKMFMH